MTRPAMNYDAVKNAMRPVFAEAEFEISAVAYLDPTGNVINVDQRTDRKISEVQAFLPREISARFTTLNATSVVIAHNHAVDVAVPSQQDYRMSVSMLRKLEKKNIPIADFLLFSNMFIETWFSWRESHTYEITEIQSRILAPMLDQNPLDMLLGIGPKVDVDELFTKLRDNLLSLRRELRSKI